MDPRKVASAAIGAFGIAAVTAGCTVRPGPGGATVDVDPGTVIFTPSGASFGGHGGEGGEGGEGGRNHTTTITF